MPSHLRVYRAPEEIDGYEPFEDDSDTLPMPDLNVRVRLGDLLPLVSMAQKMNFIWLKDFLDDEVIVSEDLHQVLQSFRSCRPSAS